MQEKLNLKMFCFLKSEMGEAMNSSLNWSLKYTGWSTLRAHGLNSITLDESNVVSNLFARVNSKKYSHKRNVSCGNADLDFHKQVRTNIGLADTIIASSLIYFIYMGGTGPCDSINILC